MHSSHRIVLPIVLASVATVAVVVPGLPRTTVAQAQSSSAAEATSRITAAAQALLAALDDAGRGKVQFPFEGPQKTRWSNLPSGIFQRQGLRLAEVVALRVEPGQRDGLMAGAGAAPHPDRSAEDLSGAHDGERLHDRWHRQRPAAGGREADS